MKTPDYQRRAINKYNKEKTRTLTIRFFPSDMHVFEHIKSQEKIARYIKDLVIEDMKKEGK